MERSVQIESGRPRDHEAVNGDGGKTDMEDDIRLLLECLHFQQHCPSSQRQALSTIATMCAHSSQCRDLFRVTGGLAYVLELLYATSSLPVQQAALYTLGCAMEKNVVNQMKLCDENFFSFLADLLKPHPSTTPTDANSALTMSVAYVCGCLMSGNAQGQTVAREKRLLHKLIAVYKCHLPSCDRLKTTDCPGGDDQCSTSQSVAGSEQSLQVWTSVSSALCAANNNPQNEVNQCVSSQLLPAALSLVGISPLSPDVLRPALSFITSCVASNETTQSRLRMIGGLKSLADALKSLSVKQDKELTSRVVLADLAGHTVQALSSAIFTHAVNTDTLCEYKVVPSLLQVLQWEGLDGHTHLSIVMCLGMLTEDRESTQHELINGGGLHLLLSILSGGCEEELSKAVTFVLQCCLPQQGQSTDASKIGDELVSAGVARIEKLLATGGQSICATTSDDKDIHDLSADSSHDQIHDLSLTSACALKPDTSVKSATPSRQTALNALDNQRLPVKTAITNWLKTVNTEHSTDNTTVGDEQKGGGVVGGACNLATRIEEHERKIADSESMKSGLAVRECTSVKEGVCEDKRDTLDTESDKDRHKAGGSDEEALQKEKRRRKELERHLEEERAKRRQLEKLVKQVKRDEEVRRDKESQKHGTSTLSGNQQHSNQHELVTETSQHVSAQATSSQAEREGTGYDDSDKENIPPNSPQVKKSNVNSLSQTSAHSTPANANSQRLSNVRYATSSSGVPSRWGKVAGGRETRAAKTCSTFMMNRLKEKANKEQACARERRGENGEKKRQYPSQSDKHEPTLRKRTLSTICENPSVAGGESSNATVLRPGTSQTSITSLPLRYLQKRDHVTITCSDRGESSRSRNDVLPSQHSLSQCNCGCLACEPRLKCPTITSRNFVKLVQFDRFTCSYHKSLVRSLTSASTSCLSARPAQLAMERDKVTLGSKDSTQLGRNARVVRYPSHCSSSLDHTSCDGETLTRKRMYGESEHGGGSTEVRGSGRSDGEHLTVGGGENVDDYQYYQDNHTCGDVPPISDSDELLSTSCDNSTQSSSPVLQKSNATLSTEESEQSFSKDPNWSPSTSTGSSHDTSSVGSNAMQYSRTNPQHIKPDRNRGGHFQDTTDTRQVECDKANASSKDSLVAKAKRGDIDSRPSHHEVPLKSERAKNKVTSTRSMQVRLDKVCLTTSHSEGEESCEQPRGNEQVSNENSESECMRDPKPCTSSQSLERARPLYNLVAKPKYSKKTTSSAQRFGVLRDITNRGSSIRGGEKKKPKKAQSNHDITVYDYTTPDKEQRSKCRSNAAGKMLLPVQRKSRVPWTDSEEYNLMHGVAKHGHQWRVILSTYKFHHSRDPVSLKDKYRNVMKYQT